jgi:hypothetical protein
MRETKEGTGKGKGKGQEPINGATPVIKDTKGRIIKERQEFKDKIDKAEVVEVEEIKKPKKAEPKKEEKPKKETMTRLHAFTLAFKEMNRKGFTKEQIIKKADDLYVKSGGTSNLKEGHWYYNYFQRFLESLQKAGLTDLKAVTFNLKK